MKNTIKFACLAATLLLVFTLIACVSSGNTNTTEQPTSEPIATATPLPTAIPKASPTPTPERHQNTVVPEKKEYTIPKAATAPVIDGTKSAGEWDNALKIVLDNNTTWDPTNGVLDCQGGEYYFMWDETGLYFFGQVTDKEESSNLPEGNNGSYNYGDGIQLCIYADQLVAAGEKDRLFFFTLCPKASDGNAYVGEHFVYGDTSAGQNVPDCEFKATATENGYTFECKINADAFQKSTPKINLAEGTSFAMANIILDADKASHQSIFCDTAWFNAPASNKYTLGK